MTFRSLVVFLSVILLCHFSACNINAVYDENVSIDNVRWSKNESVSFEVNIPDTLTRYDFYINLRHTTDYRYQNFYVFLETHFPNNNITRDTIEFILADQTGKWLGKGWGNLKENDILLKSGLTFPLSGGYMFVIEHAMRADTLAGISNIGVRIEKSN